MIIGLMGFEFSSPNKGCEALSYSFLSILNKYYQNNEDVIIYNFTEYEMGEVPSRFPNFHFVKVKMKLKDVKCKYLRALLRCDIIFDVTMGDSFSDIYSLGYYNFLMKEKTIASIVAKRYILLPQTYGPFKNIESSKKAKHVFKRAAQIYCRDSLSQTILENEFKIDNSLLVSDMAFVLPYKKEAFDFDKTDKLRVGINVSGLLYKGGFESDNQFDLSVNYKKFISDLLELFGDTEKYEIYLIPHVIATRAESSDDDYEISSMLKENNSNITLAPMFETPIDAKCYISNMDIFIGSRMHSTIAAFSSGVLTIPVSYSRKFEGLYNSIDYNYTINCQVENNDSAMRRISDYLSHMDKLSQKQEEAMEKINSLSIEFEESLFQLLQSK